MRAAHIVNGQIANVIEVAALDFLPGLVECPDGFGPGDLFDGGAFAKRPEPVQTEDDLHIQALHTLAAIDAASIRAIREWIAAKPDAPKILKDKEAAAIAVRANLKPGRST